MLGRRVFRTHRRGQRRDDSEASFANALRFSRLIWAMAVAGVFVEMEKPDVDKDTMAKKDSQSVTKGLKLKNFFHEFV